MQAEPIQFETMAAIRTKRQRCLTRTTSETPAPAVLDEAFAEFVRVDTAMPSTDSNAAANPWQSMARELVADITRQLNALDRQRQELATLLESVDLDTICR